MKHLIMAAAALATLAAGEAEAQSVKIDYAIKAKGISAGDFAFSADFADGRYQAAATRRASGFVRTLAGSSQDYAYQVAGALTPAGPKPQAYSHRGGRRDRVVNVSFAADGGSKTTAIPEMGMGDPPATEAQRKGAIDQVTMFLSLMVPPDPAQPCDRTLRVLMDGRARFDLALRADGQVEINTRAYKGKAFRCRVQYQPLAGFSEPQEPATLTFLLAPIAQGLFAPVRVEMPNDDLGVIQLDAKSLKTE